MAKPSLTLKGFMIPKPSLAPQEVPERENELPNRVSGPLSFIAPLPPPTDDPGPDPTEPVIALLTERPLDRVLSDGGTAAWTLNRSVARRHRYVVCVRNAPFTSQNENAPPHGSAFLIGRIQDIVTAPENSKKWLIKFSSIAPILFHNSWKSWRNPVKYTTIEELGISGSHKFFSMSTLRSRNNSTKSNRNHILKPDILKDNDFLDDVQNRKNAIEEAKAKLAAVFGVSIDAIEIIVKL